VRKDGTIEVRQKGTIQLLDEWFTKKFSMADRTPINDAITTFKRVRQLRQKPGYVLDENSFDQKYYHDQRQLMGKVYEAVKTVRLEIAKHPKANADKLNWVSHQSEIRIWCR
jgi:hypothetical protein